MKSIKEWKWQNALNEEMSDRMVGRGLGAAVADPQLVTKMASTLNGFMKHLVDSGEVQSVEDARKILFAAVDALLTGDRNLSSADRLKGVGYGKSKLKALQNLPKPGEE